MRRNSGVPPVAKITVALDGVCLAAATCATLEFDVSSREWPFLPKELGHDMFLSC